MKRINVGYIPAGVKFSPENYGDYAPAEKYSGVSFCDAVQKATYGAGQSLLLEPDSIDVCRWAPVVLGFREPHPQFDLKVEFHLPPPISSVLIAPLDKFKETHPPDVVLVRAVPMEIQKILRELGPYNVNTEMTGRLDRSALEVFNGGVRFDKLRVRWVNETLAALNHKPEWCEFTKWIFSREWTTFIFDLLLDRFLANMSVCRNATVIPYLTRKANVSFFCTGGIAWGGNLPGHMVCGIPFELSRNFEWTVDSPISDEITGVLMAANRQMTECAL